MRSNAFLQFKSGAYGCGGGPCMCWCGQPGVCELFGKVNCVVSSPSSSSSSSPKPPLYYTKYASTRSCDATYRLDTYAQGQAALLSHTQSFRQRPAGLLDRSVVFYLGSCSWDTFGSSVPAQTFHVSSISENDMAGHVYYIVCECVHWSNFNVVYVSLLPEHTRTILLSIYRLQQQQQNKRGSQQQHTPTQTACIIIALNPLSEHAVRMRMMVCCVYVFGSPLQRLLADHVLHTPARTTSTASRNVNSRPYALPYSPLTRWSRCPTYISYACIAFAFACVRPAVGDHSEHSVGHVRL